MMHWRSVNDHLSVSGLAEGNFLGSHVDRESTIDV